METKAKTAKATEAKLPAAAAPAKPLAYRNDRAVHAGDTVLNLATGQSGVLRDFKPEHATSNARLGEITLNGLSSRKPELDPVVNVQDCVHLDDVRKAFEK